SLKSSSTTNISNEEISSKKLNGHTSCSATFVTSTVQSTSSPLKIIIKTSPTKIPSLLNGNGHAKLNGLKSISQHYYNDGDSSSSSPDFLSVEKRIDDIKEKQELVLEETSIVSRVDAQFELIKPGNDQQGVENDISHSMDEQQQIVGEKRKRHHEKKRKKHKHHKRFKHRSRSPTEQNGEDNKTNNSDLKDDDRSHHHHHHHHRSRCLSSSSNRSLSPISREKRQRKKKKKERRRRAEQDDLFGQILFYYAKLMSNISPMTNDEIVNFSEMIQRIRLLDKFTQILLLVTDDLRRSLHKQRMLPKFIEDTFKKPVPRKKEEIMPEIQPEEIEELRLAENIIDKAKRVIESKTGDKQRKTNEDKEKTVTTSKSEARQVQQTVSPVPLSVPPPPQASNQHIRKYTPAHMKAPFRTVPENKRRNSRTHTPTLTSERRRSLSQQRRQQLPASSTITLSRSNTSQSINRESTAIKDNHGLLKETYQAPVQNSNCAPLQSFPSNDLLTIPVETKQNFYQDVPSIDEKLDDTDATNLSELNCSLIKPLRKLWKQNQIYRSKLKQEHERSLKKEPPQFLKRVQNQIYKSNNIDSLRAPDIQSLICLAVKLRLILQYLLQSCKSDDNLLNGIKCLMTLKYYMEYYRSYFKYDVNILISKHHLTHDNELFPSMNDKYNIKHIAKKSSSRYLNSQTNMMISYQKFSQLEALTELKIKEFEYECRLIELELSQKLIYRFQRYTDGSINRKLIPTYRELLSIVTDKQTSAPIIVENNSL
ncbi:unnamed protein product, partial [Didymodactylos carnosus]